MGWDDNLFREAIKKKYAIQQQEADTQQAEQIARAPVHQAQAQYYGGANATELDKTRINAAEEARKTLAQAPMWSAEARERDATAAGTELKNKANQELYGDTIAAAKSGTQTQLLQNMADSSVFGQQVNTLIQDRFKKTGERNPMLASYGASGIKYGDFVDVATPTAKPSSGAGRSFELVTEPEGEFSKLYNQARLKNIKDIKPSGIGVVDWGIRRGVSALDVVPAGIKSSVHYLADPRYWED